MKNRKDLFTSFQIVFKDGRTSGADVLLNGKSDVFKSSKGKKREMKTDSQTLFIGGIPMEDRYIFF